MSDSSRNGRASERLLKAQATHSDSSQYVGRFAASPSGSLHFGSLVAAVGSFLQAQVADGAWLIRMEDLDTPRIVPGAADNIIRSLERLGFEWQGAIEYQSKCISRYESALEILRKQRLVYTCSCSRSQLAVLEESRYPGTCRTRGIGSVMGDSSFTERFIVTPGPVEFDDALQGHFAQDVAATSGDFVVRRRDRIFSYHLAVVVDDAAQGITEVVRGADLLDSTPRHLLLQNALGLPAPAYCHLPLAVDARGQKLSKSAQSTAIDVTPPSQALWQALDFLRQSPPRELRTGPHSELWHWAKTHWSLRSLQKIASEAAPQPT